MTIPTELVVWALGVFVAILGYLFATNKKRYDNHLDECNGIRVKEAETRADMERRMKSIEDKAERTDRNVTWLGDCMISLGSKMEAHIPERPK